MRRRGGSNLSFFFSNNRNLWSNESHARYNRLQWFCFVFLSLTTSMSNALTLTSFSADSFSFLSFFFFCFSSFLSFFFFLFSFFRFFRFFFESSSELLLSESDSVKNYPLQLQTSVLSFLIFPVGFIVVVEFLVFLFNSLGGFVMP